MRTPEEEQFERSLNNIVDFVQTIIAERKLTGIWSDGDRAALASLRSDLVKNIPVVDSTQAEFRRINIERMTQGSDLPVFTPDDHPQLLLLLQLRRHGQELIRQIDEVLGNEK